MAPPRKPAPIGESFDRLRIERELPNRRYSAASSVRMVETRCTCGRIEPSRLSEIVTGAKKECSRCSRRVAVHPGDQFASLTIREELPDRIDSKGRTVRVARVHCRECGAEKSMPLLPIVRGKSQTCGCGRGRERSPAPIGKRFGDLVVTTEADDHIDDAQRVARRVEATCDCGNEVIVRLTALRQRKTRTCGKCKPGRKREHAPIGRRFGWLVIDEEVAPRVRTNGYPRRMVRTRCSCENQTVKILPLDSLTERSSCGCQTAALVRAHVVPGEQARKAVLNKCKWGARERNATWALTDEEFFREVVRPCVHCGASGTNWASDNAGDGGFAYTGLDQIVPRGGYRVGNVSPCCIDCNWAKRAYSLEEFEEWLGRFVAHRTADPSSFEVIPTEDQALFGPFDPKTKYRLPVALATRNLAFSTHRCSANHRDIVDALTKDEFTALVLSPCFYCNTPWSRAVKYQRRNGEFRCNGIDRVDPRGIYEIGNVVPACTKCNRAKSGKTFAEFESWKLRVRRHRSDPGC